MDIPVTGYTAAGRDMNTLSVDVSYNAGGVNYFSFKSERRGYYCHVQLENVSEGVRSFVVGANTGFKFLLSEETRRNKRKHDEYERRIDSLDPETIRQLYAADDRGALVDYIRGALGAKVAA